MDDRTRTELMVKSIALHIAVLISAGHLMSLQKRSWNRTKDALGQLAWFIAVPTYPFALLIDRAIRVARLLFLEGRARPSWSYCLDGVLGLHVETRSETHPASVALLAIPCKELQKSAMKRGLLGYGRLFVLFCLMAQAVGTLVLSGRRIRAGQMGDMDIRNAWMAFGGLVVQAMSAIIVLTGRRWEHIPRPLDATSSNANFRMVTIRNANQGDLGVVARLIVTTTVLGFWYFRFHIEDTIALIVLGALYNKSDSVYSAHYYPERAVLSSLVWLAWPVMIFHAQRENAGTVLFVSLFRSVGFPIQELATKRFPKWKDPLADMLYVF
jgi:hypothetical protein